MARVAICPQCSHEILILDDGNQEAWAKCPECRAFFQIGQAAAREIQAAVPVEEESIDQSGETVVMDDTMLETYTDKSDLMLSGSSDATVTEKAAGLVDAEQDIAAVEQEIRANDEFTTEIMESAVETRISVDPMAVVSRAADLSTSADDALIEESTSDVGTTMAEVTATVTPEERIEETTDRIDKWFRDTKSEVTAPIVASGDDQLTAEAVEIPIDPTPALPENQPTWENADHMERLLADVESANAPPDEDENRISDEGDAALSDDERVEIRPVGRQSEEPPPFFIPPGRLPRRKRSMVRTLATTAVSGILGLALGYYALLWILGPTGDFLNVAQYMPSAALPAEFESSLATRPLDDRPQPPTNETLTATTDETEAPGTTEQTSYTVPVDDRNSTTTDASGAGDQPPLAFDESIAAPLSQADDGGTARVTNAPTFSADELAVAVQAAQEAQPKLVTGNFADGRAVQLAKGQGYSILCDLAQKLTFVDTSERTDYLNALVTDSERLFQKTLADTHTRGEVARILPIWIASPNRKHGGVFFAGTPLKSAENGSVIEYQLDTGADKPVIVLVPPASAAQLADSSKPVAIVGWIVDSPATAISGYSGDATQAIWAGRILALD